MWNVSVYLGTDLSEPFPSPDGSSLSVIHYSSLNSGGNKNYDLSFVCNYCDFRAITGWLIKIPVTMIMHQKPVRERPLPGAGEIRLGLLYLDKAEKPDYTSRSSRLFKCCRQKEHRASVFFIRNIAVWSQRYVVIKSNTKLLYWPSLEVHKACCVPLYNIISYNTLQYDL